MTIAERRAKQAGYQRKWRARNVEHARALDRQWTRDHAEQVRESKRRDYRRNPDRGRARSAAWYRANRERALAAQRAWRLAHPAQMAGYRQDWLDAVPLREAATRCAKSANTRARMYGVDGQIGYETVLELWRREPVCVDCGDGRGLDHIYPLSLGGSNTSGNLANRCRSCNSRKGAKPPVYQQIPVFAS